jgi:hypothetical protein
MRTIKDKTMDKGQLLYINEYMYRHFLNFMDSEDAGKIADALQDDVARDIEETADKDNWNSSDVEIAMTRVLLKRVLGDEY